MKTMRRSLPAPGRIFACLLVLPLGTASTRACGEAIDFQRDIQPVLSDRCFHCHGPDEKVRKAALRFDTEEGAFRERNGKRVIVRGKSAESEIIRRITSDDPSERMPPPESKRVLSPREIDAIRRWIDEGARWGVHWAFAAPARPEPPGVKRGEWPRNPIDSFILERLEREGLEPSPEAPRETLIRRATLDLTGLPPSLEEVDAFLADRSPDAYERVIDRLLASPRHGEHMASGWLDAARYADTNGYQGDPTRTMWPWRDWVIRAINENMPFDRFTVESLAGDLLPGATVSQRIATGFHRNHMLNGEGGRIPEESRVDYVLDRVETTATVWLGLTLGCARCHDHKYDPFSQREYYQLAAYFNSIPESGAVDEWPHAKPVVPVPTQEESERIARLEKSVADLKDAVGKEEAGASRDELRKKLDAEEKALRDARTFMTKVMVMEDLETPREMHILLRGAYDKPGEKVSPGVPAVLPPLPPGAPPNRLALARWLVDPAHPLTARVTVNRIWQLFFGTGIVKTVEDFGVQGERPSHPELLDWLATELVRSGWDMKAMHRLIATSAVYRQSSRATKLVLERDPENRLLARGPRFRLSSAAIRDQALAASGLLVEQIGGPSVKPYQPPGVWEEMTFGQIQYAQDRGESLYRRSLYTFWRRTVAPTMMFDAASRQYCTVRHSRTNSPLHALITLNDVTYSEAARKLAERALKEGGADEEARLGFAFRLSTARRPSAAESAVLRGALERLRKHYAGDHEAAAKLVRAGESPRDESIDVAELAAWTGVASLVLNLDETLTKE
jgi:hypothetical protein